jgi:DNA-binding NarL/FixJ family response regulator
MTCCTQTLDSWQRFSGAQGSTTTVGTIRMGKLTKREIETLSMVADGFTTDEIAAALYLSPNTIKTHKKRIVAKLGVHNITEAVYRVTPEILEWRGGEK